MVTLVESTQLKYRFEGSEVIMSVTPYRSISHLFLGDPCFQFESNRLRRALEESLELYITRLSRMSP